MLNVVSSKQTLSYFADELLCSQNLMHDWLLSVLFMQEFVWKRQSSWGESLVFSRIVIIPFVSSVFVS